MNAEHADRTTTLNDLPEDIRDALLQGWTAADPSYVSSRDLADAADDPERLAFLDGLRLAGARDLLRSASMSDYKTDERRYDNIALEMNARYGERLVITSDEFSGPDRKMPGFRS